MNEKEQERLKKEAKDYLYRYIEAGQDVYCVLNSVSNSGMTRHITVLLPICLDGNKQIINISYYVASLLGYKFGKENSVVVGGCGMDMGFHIINSLSIALFGLEQTRHLKNNWL